MKCPRVIVATLIAIATIKSAWAQTVIHITGSTAYRAAVYQAITDILQPGFMFGYSGSTASKASQAIYTGTTKTGSLPVIIKASFSGSVGGISTLAANLTIGPGGSFTGGGGWLVDSTPQSTAGTPNAPANYDPAVTADVAMADCFQASAPAILSDACTERQLRRRGSLCLRCDKRGYGDQGISYNLDQYQRRTGCGYFRRSES